LILVTVGTQFPFDRLVRAVDDWAWAHPEAEVFAQIGATDYRPRHMACTAFVSPSDMRRMQEDCDVMVAHAGMGSILTALELGKPIIIMPRDHARGEHRNGHQFGTIRHFSGRRGIYAAPDETALPALLDHAGQSGKALPKVSRDAPSEFIAALRGHLDAVLRKA